MIKFSAMKTIFYFFIFGMVIANSGCSKKDDEGYLNSKLEEIASLSTFETNIKSGVSLVFFHATWCPKCAAQRPAVEALLSDASLSETNFSQVNYEAQTDIVSKYEVIGFPTIVIYKNGSEVHRFEGQGYSQKTLTNKLLEYL